MPSIMFCVRHKYSQYLITMVKLMILSIMKSSNFLIINDVNTQFVYKLITWSFGMMNFKVRFRIPRGGFSSFRIYK